MKTKLSGSRNSSKTASKPCPEQLHAIASRVRKERVKAEGDSLGRCHDWSRHVQTLLLAHGIESVLVCGKFVLDLTGGSVLNEASHYWIEVQGYVIDITADQFNSELGGPMPDVVVAKHETYPGRYIKGFASTWI